MALSRSAPAKINLGLHVLRKRADGYHDVETVLHRIAWADEITAEPADALSMTCTDPALPTDGRNLCVQAARQLAEAFDVERGAALHLDKQVPYGAGLGGGSSDAAATLRLLSALWEIDPPPDRLHAIAASLGADVPFFLLEEPAALGTGRGEQLTPLYADGDPYRVPHPLVVIVPPVEVPTGVAYSRVHPEEAGRPDLRALVPSNDMGRWRAELVNDFEAPITDAYPSVRAARALLREQGGDYVSLSGSGGAVYGVFTAHAQAEAACKVAREEGYRVHLTMPDPGCVSR